MLKVTVILGIFLVSSCVAGSVEHVPVLMWGAEKAISLPALKTVKSDEFSALVEAQTDGGSTTLVFVEPKLSVEDFSQCKLKSRTCFHHLQKFHHKNFIQNVEDPVETLMTLFPDHKTYRESEKIQSGDVIFIYMNEVNSMEDFEEHDKLISQIYHKAREQDKDVVAIYTSRLPSFTYNKPLKRRARATEEDTKQLVQKVDNQIYVALASITFHTKTDSKNVPFSAMTLTVDGYVPTTAEKRGSMTVKINSGDSGVVEMFVTDQGFSWEIESIKLGAEEFAFVKINGNDGISYACSDLTIHSKTKNVSLTFIGFQIQPMFRGSVTNFQFGLDNNCTGFFSPAIWGGLFIVFLLLAILITGITFIMDINTMDKFDDPKGKTITIHAQE
jgi:V-type H+-transporting ATPase S1 subunit